MWTKIASLVLLWTCVTAVKYKCPDHIPRDSATGVYGRYCFRAELNMEKEFGDASYYCWNNGGSLAMVKSQGINDFLTGMIRDNLGFYGRLWIGLNDIEDENTFRWADGSLMDYSNWNSDEEGPRGGLVQHHVEDCVSLDTETGGTWHDHRCESLLFFHNAEKRFICQYPTKIITTPAPPSTTTTTMKTTVPTTTTTTTAPPTTPQQTTTTTTTQTTTTTKKTTKPPTTTATTTRKMTTLSDAPKTQEVNLTTPQNTKPTTNETRGTTAPQDNNTSNVTRTEPPSTPSTTTTPPPTVTSHNTTSEMYETPSTSATENSTTTTTTTTPPTPPPQPSNATTEEKPPCPNQACDLECDMDGFKTDPLTGCVLCQCDDK